MHLPAQPHIRSARPARHSTCRRQCCESARLSGSLQGCLNSARLLRCRRRSRLLPLLLFKLRDLLPRGLQRLRSLFKLGLCTGRSRGFRLRGSCLRGQPLPGLVRRRLRGSRLARRALAGLLRRAQRLIRQQPNASQTPLWHPS